MTAVVEVAAAILLRRGEEGLEYLLAQRPQGKVYAGYWEFPGGKLEKGETLHDALVRELREEMGISIDSAWPWLSREFTYPHARVRLKFFRVSAWRGEISLLEHSGLAWTRVGTAPAMAPILPANGPILRALELPALYALTNAAANGVEAELARIAAALEGGLRLLQIRDKDLPADERSRFAHEVMALAADYRDAIVLVNDDASLAQEIGAHGVHLSASGLMRASRRPQFAWVGASCHDDKELAQATRLGIDFALLSPVLPTPSHPQVAGIGWEAFARQVERAAIPVFALGGMRSELLATACQHGAHGIALLRGWR